MSTARRVLPALRIRDFAQARPPNWNRIVSTRLARFLSVRRRRRQRRAGPTLSLDQVADPRSHPVVFSFLHLNFIALYLNTTQSIRQIRQSSFFPPPSSTFIAINNHDLTFRHTILPRHSHNLQLCLSPTLWNPLRHSEPNLPFASRWQLCHHLLDSASRAFRTQSDLSRSRSSLTPRRSPSPPVLRPGPCLLPHPLLLLREGSLNAPIRNATRHRLNSRHVVFYIQ